MTQRQHGISAIAKSASSRMLDVILGSAAQTKLSIPRSRKYIDDAKYQVEVQYYGPRPWSHGHCLQDIRCLISSVGVSNPYVGILDDVRDVDCVRYYSMRT